MLQPGDLVDIELELKAGLYGTLENLAVSEVKKSLAADRRFRYQGSREIESFETETGEPYRAIIITVQVADLSKVTGSNPRPTPPLEAGVSWIKVITLVSIVAGAIAAYSGAIAYRAYVIRRIATSGESDAVKVAALQAAGQPLFGTGSLGGVGMAVIIIAVLWVLTRTPRGG
jgi:hypothetical protein